MLVALVSLGYVALPVVMFTAALRFVSSDVQGVLFALLPLATAVIAHRLVLEKRLTPRKFVGLVIGVTGGAGLVSSRTDGITAEAFDPRGHLLTSSVSSALLSRWYLNIVAWWLTPVCSVPLR